MRDPVPSATTGGSTATVETQYAYDIAGRLCRVVENTTSGTDVQGLANPCSAATQDAGTAIDAALAELSRELG